MTVKIFCDDGSTNVKLAWFDGEELKTLISPNSFRTGWKVSDMGGQSFNYTVDGHKYTWDSVSRDAITTTNVDYQYGDLNLLAVHHALHQSGLTPQPVSLVVTLPVSEYYDQDCQKNEDNIRRKTENLLRPLVLNRQAGFTVESVSVMPESLPAVFSRLAESQTGPHETSLVIDLGGTTLDTGVIVGQFEDISAIHGNTGLGVSSVTRAALAALRVADSDTSPLVANEVIRRRHDAAFLSSVINNADYIGYVVDKINEAVDTLGMQVTMELVRFRHVNRVFLVGGGAELIEEAVRRAWALAPERIEVIRDPQTALVREIARFRKED